VGKARLKQPARPGPNKSQNETQKRGELIANYMLFQGHQKALADVDGANTIADVNDGTTANPQIPRSPDLQSPIPGIQHKSRPSQSPIKMSSECKKATNA